MRASKTLTVIALILLAGTALSGRAVAGYRDVEGYYIAAPAEIEDLNVVGGTVAVEEPEPTVVKAVEETAAVKEPEATVIAKTVDEVQKVLYEKPRPDCGFAAEYIKDFYTEYLPAENTAN